MDLLDNGKASPPQGGFHHYLPRTWLTDLAGALSVEHLKRIVVDASYIDQKKRGVLDMKDTMMPLAKWLTRKELKDRYIDDEKHLDLLFF